MSNVQRPSGLGPAICPPVRLPALDGTPFARWRTDRVLRVRSDPQTFSLFRSAVEDALPQVFAGEAPDRVKLEDFTIERVGERCSGRVRVAWDGSGSFVGEAEGEADPLGQLGCAARATAAALERAVDGRAAIGVDGVDQITGFETVLVTVAVSVSTASMDERVSGCATVKGPAGLGAVLAVLSATNRLLSRALEA